jgi:multiple sugar transport system substrate-binding protein
VPSAHSAFTSPPTTRTEFTEAARKVTARGGDIKGWILPLSLETPNGIQNDVMSWNWVSRGSMLKDGKPVVSNADVKATVDYVKSLWDAGVVAPGALTMKEQDKVEEFTNGRVGMMIGSLAWGEPDSEEQPEPEVQHLRYPGERRVHW